FLPLPVVAAEIKVRIGGEAVVALLPAEMMVFPVIRMGRLANAELDGHSAYRINPGFQISLCHLTYFLPPLFAPRDQVRSGKHTRYREKDQENKRCLRRPE